MAAVPYVLERININNVGTLGGLADVSISEGLGSVLEASGSNVDPVFHTTHAQEPEIQATTMDVGVLLNAAMASGRIGAYITITSSNWCDVYFQATAAGGTRGTCIKGRINKGLLVVERVDGAPLGRCAIRIYADYDGTNAPIVISTGVSVLSGNSGAASVWRLAAVKDNSTTIHKIAEWAIEFNHRIERLRPSNSSWATDTMVRGFAPTARFSTYDIGAALTLSGLSGAAAGAAGLLFYLAQYNAATVGFSSSGALTLGFRTGSIYYPVGVDLGPGSPKPIEYMVHGVGGDTLADIPLVLATGASVPSESTGSAQYMQGPLKENTTEIDVSGGRFDFGQTWTTEGPATLPWPNFCYLSPSGRQPRIRVRSRDAAAYAARSAAAAIATAFYCYFRRVDVDGQPTADASASHVKITVNAGVIRKEQVGGGWQDSMQAELTVVALTHASGILTIATSSAIT